MILAFWLDAGKNATDTPSPVPLVELPQVFEKVPVVPGTRKAARNWVSNAVNAVQLALGPEFCDVTFILIALIIRSPGFVVDELNEVVYDVTPENEAHPVWSTTEPESGNPAHSDTFMKYAEKTAYVIAIEVTPEGTFRLYQISAGRFVAHVLALTHVLHPAQVIPEITTLVDTPEPADTTSA